MKTIFLFFIFCSLYTLGQEQNQATSKLDPLPEWANSIDSLITDSSNKHYDFTYISERIKEGLMTPVDSINGTLVELGTGAFTTHIYTDRNVNQIIRSNHSQVMHYNEDLNNDMRGKDVRYTFVIYFKDEKPVFAIYEEKVKRKGKIINHEYLHVQLNSDDPSQKNIRADILRFAKEQITNKS